MKKIVSLIVIFVFQTVVAQNNNNINISWVDGNYSVTENYKVSIPNFKSDFFIYDAVKKSILFSKKLEVPFAINEESLKLSNIIYETIAEEKLGDLDKSQIPEALNATILNAKARVVNYGLLTFSPIIKEGNYYKRVKSLNFDYVTVVENEVFQKNIATLSNSVLKTGVWRKFYVQKSGIYRISKAFLSSLGFDVNVDPRTIKIYGNGGRMIPLTNSVPYPTDLAENAIQFDGESDGVFNDGDSILFYAEGVDNYNTDSDTHINLYAEKSYYYVTSSASNGKRISSILESTQSPDVIFTTYDEYQYHEIDMTNLARLGRKWYGEQFKVTNDQNFQFSFPNIVTTSPILLKVQTAAVSVGNSTFSVRANNINVGNINLSASSSSVLGNQSALINTINATSANISINLSYNNNGVPSAAGYLDYISLKAKSKLNGLGKQFKFSVEEVSSSLGTCEYQISNASSIGQVWDITDIYNVTAKVNAGQSLFSFKTFMGEERKYIIVDNFDVYTPLKDGNTIVNNQDLKGTVFLNNQGVFNDVDYLIISPASLSIQAERLVKFHSTNSNLNVKVVNLENLYEEFSSGKQDIGAIRNFVKYVYENPSAPSETVKYLCLFGDASYDFKDKTKNNTNIVPSFQSMESFSLSGSFVSDDYFGLMDPNEGSMTSALGLDVAVGRMLVSSLPQAEQMVTKVIDYYDKKSYGRWRNNLVFLSDDVDKDSDATLETDLDDLTNRVTQEKPFFNPKKIHTDSYVQETTSGGQKYPKAKVDFINSFEQGALVFNYFGHGGEDGLAGERLFETKDAMALNNRYKYPLFITVTCEFTRFDNPSRPTAGEQTYWNPFGGAVSMVTTTRQIGQSTGEIFNVNFASKLFAYGNNNYPSIAEAVRLTKVMSSNSGNNVVFYIGDPALKLAIPKPKIRLTKINGVPITGSPDVLQALAYATISGEVTDEFDAPITNYNGELAVSIYDKDINRTTLGNDGTYVNGVLQVMNFTTLGEAIFRGNASVTNGLFEFGFVVPRDIKMPVGTGKISFYAKNNNILEDQTGYDLSLKIGGLNVNAVADVVPPKIRIYMNDESFASGGITNQSPLFLAFLEDEHGINTASGIGHDIVAYLDGDETKPYILNDFYETELNNYTKGKLKYPFRNLAIGLHTLTFKAWDVYNNIVTADLQFIVAGDETLSLTNVLNYPNPFVNYTEFWFTHNKPLEQLEVQVQVFTITGKIVWTKNQIVSNEGFTSRDITWDGRDDFGDKIGKGVYVYKLTVKSNVTNKKTEKIEKLVIL
ncbi:type IX secretion system sortase PorU [Flavobacterium sp.]|uniref:type IX secretion system sortase PorU n=1 Tax=Flavobacterium sp. TaxID=239 RepID=UPI0037512A54